MYADVSVLDDRTSTASSAGDSADSEIPENETHAIIEEFVQCKLKSKGKFLQHRTGTPDFDTHLLVGRLIEISNELEIRYGAQLNRDAEQWIESATFEKFVQIAKGVFADGQISWSRIVVLFMFTVKVVSNAFSRNLGGLAGDVIRFTTKFVFLHGIYKWVASRGGWLAVLQEYGSGSTAGGILVFTGLLLIVLLLLKKSA